MRDKKTVLLFHPTINESGVIYLKEQDDIEVILAPDNSIDTIMEYIESADGIIARTEYICSKIMDKGKKLKVVGENGVGVDNIDVCAATARNIAVVNAPLANYVSVAEHVVMYVLALSKRLRLGDIAVRANNFSYRDVNLPHEIANKNMFLIGFGRNARATADILIKGFGVNVSSYDPYVPREQMEKTGVKFVGNLLDGFAEADFVSLHLPSLQETRHLINKDTFDRMKGCCFINCARGPIVDYNALYDALQDGRVAYAGLDVFDPEPPLAEDKILTLPNIICSPHMAGDTFESKQRAALAAAQGVVSVLRGQQPDFLVNKQLISLFQGR